MSNEEKLRSLQDELDMLDKRSREIKGDIESLKQQMIREAFGIDIGDIIEASRAGWSTTSLQRYRICRIEVGYWDPLGSYSTKPDIYGNPQKKDGTFSDKLERRIWGNWKLVGDE